MSLAQIIYGLFLYKRVAKSKGHPEAMFILAIIQAATIFSVVHSTGAMLSPFILMWLFAGAMSGMFGLYGTGGTAFLSIIYYVLSTSNASDSGKHPILSFSALAIILIISALSHIFWKSRYLDQNSSQLAYLQGELKANQHQSELLVQSLSDGVFMIDTEGTITLINPSAAKLVGWQPSDAIGTDYRSVIVLLDEKGESLESSLNPIAKIIDMLQPSDHTYQLKPQSGEPLMVSLVTSPIVDTKTNKLQGVIVVLRDISIAHKSEKQQADFVSTASHEMRTPVAAIEGYLQLALNDKVASIDPRARDYLTKALDSAHHLGQLFQDLLTSAKAEDGRLVNHAVVTEMGVFLENLSETFKFTADRKGLTTEFVVASSTSSQGNSRVVKPLYYTHVDQDRLREVITNLFDNAVKYTSSGKITIGLTGNNEVVQLFVKDTGPGIPPEDVPHLFQKFYRVDNSATRTVGGTGLGLYICKEIIDMYKGRIWAESTVDVGSTFYINLPRLSHQQADTLRAKEAQTSTLAQI